jgi:hypothetical protein
MQAVMFYCLMKQLLQLCRKKAAFLKRGSSGGCLFFLKILMQTKENYLRKQVFLPAIPQIIFKYFAELNVFCTFVAKNN